MNREQLTLILRYASAITQDQGILIIGSQAILATYSDEELPARVTMSIEADVAFFDDADEHKADLVDGGIGEASEFHEEFGVYGQGVSVSTASLPVGWRGRLVPFADTGALCLEPHDLVVAKLVAGREKDRRFAKELLQAGLVDAGLLIERARTTEEAPTTKRRVVEIVEGLVRTTSRGGTGG